MFERKQLLLPALIILLFSCSNNGIKYTKSIKDFKAALQPQLTKIVSKGVVGYYSSSLSMLTDVELIQLSQSEHPVLRATAFREMLDRKSFNLFDIVMNHLDDTAVVLIDAGEFGIWNRFVSDDILEEAEWQTKEEKSKTIDEVITKHNYLKSAYLILLKVKPQEKYYAAIKDMATRSINYDTDYGETSFADIEYALYGLAKFRKAGDIRIIKNQLMNNFWQISHISFRLMREYPDTAYLDVFQNYHRRRFYDFSGHRRDGFSGIKPDRAEPEDFIRALAVQQNDRSAQLFDTILNRLPSFTCMPYKEDIEDELVLAIWENSSPAFAWLREKVKARADTIIRQRPVSIVDPNYEPSEVVESLRWYP